MPSSSSSAGAGVGFRPVSAGASVGFRPAASASKPAPQPASKTVRASPRAQAEKKKSASPAFFPWFPTMGSSSTAPTMDASDAPAPATVPASVDQTHTHTASTSSVMEFGTTVKALANRAMDAMSARTSAPSDDTNCSVHSEAFHHCLNSHEFDDMGKCHYYVDMLAHCSNNSTC